MGCWTWVVFQTVGATSDLCAAASGDKTNTWSLLPICIDLVDPSNLCSLMLTSIVLCSSELVQQQNCPNIYKVRSMCINDHKTFNCWPTNRAFLSPGFEQLAAFLAEAHMPTRIYRHIWRLGVADDTCSLFVRFIDSVDLFKEVSHAACLYLRLDQMNLLEIIHRLQIDVKILVGARKGND